MVSVFLDRCRCKTVKMCQKTYVRNNYNYGESLGSSSSFGGGAILNPEILEGCCQQMLLLYALLVLQ